MIGAIVQSVMAEEENYQRRVAIAREFGAEPPTRKEPIITPIKKEANNDGLIGGLIGFIFGASL